MNVFERTFAVTSHLFLWSLGKTQTSQSPWNTRPLTKVSFCWRHSCSTLLILGQKKLFFNPLLCRKAINLLPAEETYFVTLFFYFFKCILTPCSSTSSSASSLLWSLSLLKSVLVLRRRVGEVLAGITLHNEVNTDKSGRTENEHLGHWGTLSGGTRRPSPPGRPVACPQRLHTSLHSINFKFQYGKQGSTELAQGLMDDGVAELRCFSMKWWLAEDCRLP